MHNIYVSWGAGVFFCSRLAEPIIINGTPVKTGAKKIVIQLKLRSEGLGKYRYYNIGEAQYSNLVLFHSFTLHFWQQDLTPIRR
jgi:hypothetical protein